MYICGKFYTSSFPFSMPVRLLQIQTDPVIFETIILTFFVKTNCSAEEGICELANIFDEEIVDQPDPGIPFK